MKVLAKSLSCVLVCVALSCASGTLGVRPVVTFRAPQTTGTNLDVIVHIEVSDADLSKCDLAFEFTTDGVTWSPMTITSSTAGGVSGSRLVSLGATRAGVDCDVTWDTWTDDVAKAGAVGTVRVRVTPSDVDGAGQSRESSAFTIDNFIPDMALSVTEVAMQAGLGDAEPQFDITVLNNGLNGPMEWEAVVDTGTGPAWLTTSPTQGDTAAGDSTKVTLAVSTIGLTEGTYSATVTVSDRAAAAMPSHGSPQVLPITLEVGSPVLSLDVASLTFSEDQDTMAVSAFRDPTDVTLTVSNTGPTYTNLVWSLANDETWLSADTLSGSLPGGASQTVTLSAEATAPALNGLADPVGNAYTDTITVSDIRGINADQTIPVSLPVRWQRPNIQAHDNTGPPPADITTIAFECVAAAGLRIPADQSMWIGNSSPEPDSLLLWTATETGSATWLSLDTYLNTVALAPGASDAVVLSANGTGLTPGLYEEDIVIAGWDDQHAPPDEPALSGDVTIHVTLLVKAPASVDLTPDSLGFLNGIRTTALPDPSSGTVTMRNYGGLALSWSSSWVGGAPTWLSCLTIPSSGTVNPGGADSHVFSFTVTGPALALPAGDYTATVRILDQYSTATDFVVTLHMGTRDLQVVSMSHSPTSPEQGDQVTFTVSISNTGDVAASSFMVGFWGDRTSAPSITTPPTSTASVSYLAANSTTTKTFTATAPAAGTNRAWAYADCSGSTGSVPETNETNNAGPTGGYAWASAAGPDGDIYEDDDMFSEATEIDNGVTQTHTLHDSFDYDYVKFYVLPGDIGDTVTVLTSGAYGDTEINLYGPSFNILGSNDDYAAPIHYWSRITYQLQEAGWHYVQVRGWNGTTIGPPGYQIDVSW